MSRRKRASCGVPGRITGAELLHELEAVAVGVEDVEDAHLVMELEHGADVDVLAPKTFGLRLDVVDVDRGDASVLLRLALRDRDVHLSALELRPAAFVVDVRLLEAELAGVERASRLEVADVVPDADHSASPGSSRSVFTFRRNSAALAPSAAR